MKKLLSIVFALTLVMAIAAGESAAQSDAAKNASVLFATFEVGTSNYNVSAELAKLGKTTALAKLTFNRSLLAAWERLICFITGKPIWPSLTARLQNGQEMKGRLARNRRKAIKP